MSKYPEQNDSKKRDRRKKAIALSVGTCLLMGIAAFEIYRLSDDPVQKTKSVGLILPDPIDARYQRDLGEIESRLYDIKRLLFVKDAALENARLKTIREKLREKDVLVQNLETEKQSIEAKLEKEQAKLIELEKTIATLIDTVDLHKGTKEQGQEKLYRQLDEERYSHTQEVLKLNQEIAQAKQTEEDLRTELLARIENEKQLESAKNSTIQLLKTELAQHVDTLKVYENQISDLQNEKTRLTDEINQHHELVRNHEDAGIEQAAYISSLNAKLTETELELAAVISKGQVQDKTIVELEDSIKSLITRTAGDQQEYDNYRKAQEDRLSQAETELARLLDEREKLVIELKENYHRRDELNQVAEKGTDLEDQLQIEKTLRAKLSQDHLALNEAYKAYKSNTDESGRSLKDLEEALATEREKVQRLEEELNQNLSKIDALTTSLNEERTLTEELSKLKDSLSSKLNETSLVYTQHVNTEQELQIAKQISDFNLATIFSDLQLEKSRLNDSNLELDSLKRHADNLTLEIARLVDENQILNNKIATRQANNPSLSELEKQKDDIEALTLHLQNQLNDERSRIETLKLEQDERQNQISRLNEELEKERTAAKELEENKIALQEQLNATHAQYESTLSRLSELESREKERNDLVQKLTDDLEKQIILNSELEDQLANAPKTEDSQERLLLIEQLKKQLEEEKALTANLKTEKEEFENELNAARADKDKLKGIQAEIQSRDEWIEHLTKQLEIEKETNETLARLSNSLETEKGSDIHRLTLELEGLKATHSDRLSEIAALTNQLDSAKERIDYYSDVERMHDAKVDEVDRLTKELSEARKHADTIVNLQQELDQAKAALAKNDNSETNAEVERLNQLLTQARAENEKIPNLQQEIDELKNAIAKYSENESELNKYKSEYERLTVEIAALRNENDNILKEKQSKIEVLTSELEETKASIAMLSGNKAELERLNSEYDRLNAEMDRLKNDHAYEQNDKQSRIEALNEELNQAKIAFAKNESLESEVQRLTQSLEEAKAENEKIASLQKELDDTKAAIAQHSGSQAELEKLKSDYDRLTLEMDSLKNDHAYAQTEKQSKIEALTEELNQAKIAFAKNESLESEVQRLTQSLEEAKAENEKIASLQKELDDTKAAIAQHSGSQAELEKLKSDYDRLTLEMDSLKNDHANAQTEKQSKIEALTDELNQAKIALAKNDALEAEIQRLSQLLDHANAENEKIASLQKELDETKAAIAQHSGSQAELEKYKRDYDRLTLEMDSLKNDHANAQTEKQSKIEALTDELNQAKIALAKNDALESEIQRLTQLLDQAKTENEKIASLQNELNDTKAAIAKHKESEAELEKLKSDYENLNLELSSLKKDQDYLLNEKQSKIEALTQEIESAKQAYASSIQSKEEIEADFEARKKVIEELSLSLEQEKSINEKLKTDTSDLNQKLLTLKDESSKCVENAENRILSLQSQISQEYERMTAIQTELNDKTRHISDIKSDLDEEKGRNLTLIEELQKAEKAHSELNALKKEKEEILQNLNKLKEEISYTENKLSNREKQLADLESEKLQLHDKVNVLHTEKNDLKSDYETRIKQEQQ